MQENLTYIKNKKGETKSAFIISDNPNLSSYNNFQKNSDHYLPMPKETEVKFNDNVC